MTLSQVAAALAVLCACAPAPPPRPLANTAAPGAPRAPAPPACPPAVPEPVKLPSAAVGGIAGTVVDEHCELVAGATILVRVATQDVREQISDERGRFTVLDLPPGRYVVAVYYLATTLQRGGIVIRAGAVEHMQLAMPPPVKAEPRITQDLQRP
ncbi:MAG TPA: carboxypeptidase-like regulatory domain-containing protein [Kofleriaceae bacterium]|nr:carboxypeptidase-like regulatory domain-containing protein [Kofleriaceae bacterium]